MKLLFPLLMLLLAFGLHLAFRVQWRSRCPKCSRDLKGFKGIACPYCGKTLRIANLDGPGPDAKAASAGFFRDIAARMIPAFKAASYRTRGKVVERTLAAKKLSLRENFYCVLWLAAPPIIVCVPGGYVYSTYFPPQSPIPFFLLVLGPFFAGGIAGVFLSVRQKVKFYRPLLLHYLSTSCPKCGHDLTGTSGRCPECGAEAPTASDKTEPESLRLV